MACLACELSGAVISYPHVHLRDGQIEYLKERIVQPEPRERWLPHAFRNDLTTLCQSGKATTGRILDLLEMHGLQVVRVDRKHPS